MSEVEVTEFYKDNKVTILNGHVITELQSLPPESVHMSVLSPPYWGLRDYGLPPQVWDDEEWIACKDGIGEGCEHEWGEEAFRPEGGNPNNGLAFTGTGAPETRLPGLKERVIERKTSSQGQFCQKCNAWRGSLGLEPDPDLYISHIVQVFREIWRVLRSDGVIFLNLGDSYWGGKGQSGHGNPEFQQERFDKGISFNVPASHVAGQGKTRPQDGKHPTLKPKDLCMIPARVTLALQADGWWLRRDIIWFKDNPMPESVNGWRWERHRVKVGRGGATEYKPAGWDTREASHDKIDGNYQDRQHEAKYKDCPGCPKCTPNDGLILRKGAWRPTSAHEYVFMLTKSDTYFCDAEAVREPHSPDGRKDTQFKGSTKYANGFGPGASMSPLRGHERWPNSGRNLRSVWTIATQPFKEAHFATFPEKLVEPCIKAGTSEKGCCPECGAPWTRIVEKKGGTTGKSWHDHSQDEYKGQSQGSHPGGVGTREAKAGNPYEVKTIGWRPSCDCLSDDTTPGPSLDDGVRLPFDPIPCTVLDPFGGSGRTAIVAKKLGRKCISIELKESYCSMPLKELSQERIF